MQQVRAKPAVERAATHGFTLIELLAVIVILAILAAFLATNLKNASDTMDVQVTRVNGLKIKAAIDEHIDDTGDAPRSSFIAEWGEPPNNSNLGAECLYLSICAENASGFGLFDEMLCNGDGDQTAKRVPGFEALTLFELGDQWGNPYAYFHHRDYSREDQYETVEPETGEPVTSRASAMKNPDTGRYYEPRGFQLISAGPDGEFGTDDDVPINFKPGASGGGSSKKPN